ncbi:putative mitochondrial protein [Cardamine amara subsp. amara]|uniref:Mitochondrial protein n=1 Tax=Cardamine amara subsp. amara TaxID=228776 RepID=A0ABD1BL65_CARAN
MYCVSLVTYSVLVNDNSHGFIKLERGIEQGDPLSPFLFILCAEALVNILNKAEGRGSLNGVRALASGPAVHHLLFADDSLLLCKASREEIAELKHCLHLYGEALVLIPDPEPKDPLSHNVTHV